MHADQGRRARTLADINREAYIYFGAGATVAWQMAMPGVGRGVTRHSQPCSARSTGCARPWATCMR